MFPQNMLLHNASKMRTCFHPGIRARLYKLSRTPKEDKTMTRNISHFVCLSTQTHTTKFLEDPNNEIWNKISFFILALTFQNPAPTQLQTVLCNY